jgi:L-2-hydroxycarboxylate dehydrogenase (NAD+)
VDRLVNDIRSSERLPSVERIWLPGEQSHERRTRYQQAGIPVADALLTELHALAKEVGVAPLVTEVTT